MEFQFSIYAVLFQQLIFHPPATVCFGVRYIQEVQWIMVSQYVKYCSKLYYLIQYVSTSIPSVDQEFYFQNWLQFSFFFFLLQSVQHLGTDMFADFFNLFSFWFILIISYTECIHTLHSMHSHTWLYTIYSGLKYNMMLSVSVFPQLPRSFAEIEKICKANWHGIHF